jgi:hypothetical protein
VDDNPRHLIVVESYRASLFGQIHSPMNLRKGAASALMNDKAGTNNLQDFRFSPLSETCSFDTKFARLAFQDAQH